MKNWEFRCGGCNAQLTADLSLVGGLVECKYCHRQNPVPRKEASDELLNYLHDGTSALDVCKFEDAFTYFQRAAELDPNEPEAFFGMALATFRVQYLKDEVNDCLQPICHEISEKVFTEDKNYKRALELATVEQKKVYRRKGGEIDDIRDEFFALQKSGLSYDCFLCVKVTEEDGRTHTEDYNRANDIYYHLKDSGYKPFYSEREMKGRTGSAYEALILYALYTSECMLIVCSNEDYLQTKWVKNEYTRFLGMMQEGGKERDAVTFVFAGKPIEKLPNGKKIQGIDLTKPDAYTRITEYVKVHTPEARKAAEEQRKAREALEEKLFELPQNAGSASGGENEELLKELRLAREARERAEKEEEERKQREYLSQFQIKDGVLTRYIGRKGTVIIPESVISIGEHAFKDCGFIKRIEIPSSVTSIGNYAFEGCTGLAVITISDGVTTIGDSAFQGCKELAEITIPSSVISIGNGAFLGCMGLTEITIPDSVTSIGNSAFENCTQLSSIIIPKSVTSVGINAFKNCSLLRKVIIQNGLTSIGTGMFDHCSNLVEIIIPNSVTSIGDHAFMDCRLAKITLPGRVTSIGDDAFANCLCLREIKIPDTVTSIGKCAFYGCWSLTEITIPKNVTSIGYSAFRDCNGLRYVTIPKRLDTGFMHSTLKSIFDNVLDSNFDPKKYTQIKFTFI